MRNGLASVMQISGEGTCVGVQTQQYQSKINLANNDNNCVNNNENIMNVNIL